MHGITSLLEIFPQNDARTPWKSVGFLERSDWLTLCADGWRLAHDLRAVLGRRQAESRNGG